jgi:hypothetical protein
VKVTRGSPQPSWGREPARLAAMPLVAPASERIGRAVAGLLPAYADACGAPPVSQPQPANGAEVLLTKGLPDPKEMLPSPLRASLHLAQQPVDEVVVPSRRWSQSVVKTIRAGPALFSTKTSRMAA